MNHGHTRARTPGRLTHWEDTWACITWSSSTEVAWKHPPCARHRHTTDRSHKGRVREERNPSTKKAQQPQKQQKPQETIRCSQREGEKKNFQNCCGGLYATALLTRTGFLLPPKVNSGTLQLCQLETKWRNWYLTTGRTDSQHTFTWKGSVPVHPQQHHLLPPFLPLALSNPSYC